VNNKHFKINLNGFPEAVREHTTIAQLVEEHGGGDQHIIVERNGRFVYRRDYEAVRVEMGDEIEIVHPDFGG
jgi:thiamine biosynthesis protein ThiS